MRPKLTRHRVSPKVASASMLGLLIVLVVGLAAPPPAFSALRPSLSLSKDKGIDQRNYPDPLIGTQSAAPSSPFAGGTYVDGVPADCAGNVRTCDTIDFDLDAPAEPNPDDPYTIKWTLNWKPGPTGNDLDFLVWQCTNVSARTGCARVKRASGSAGGEEVTGVANLPGRRYAIVVQNMTGVNEGGYSLKTEWLDGKFVEFPRAQPTPTVPPDTRSVREPPARPSVEPVDTSSEEEKAKLKAAKTPGPDGPLTDLEIAALGRKSEAASDRGPWPWLALAIGLALAGGLTFVFLRRRRLAAQESAGP